MASQVQVQSKSNSGNHGNPSNCAQSSKIINNSHYQYTSIQVVVANNNNNNSKKKNNKLIARTTYYINKHK